MSNIVIMGSGSTVPPYTPLIETVPPRRTASNAVRSASRRSIPAVWMALRASGLGSRLATAMAFSAMGLPCVSIPTASSTPSAPRPSVRSRTTAATSSTSLRSIAVAPAAVAAARRSGTRSTAITCWTPRWSAPLKEPLVRTLVREPDRTDVGVRHAGRPGPPAGRPAVQARVAEEAGALALVDVLRGLALVNSPRVHIQQ